MARLTVRDIMTESPYTLNEDTDLAQVYDLMDDKHIRHVPVVDPDGRLLGIVSHRDLVRGALSAASEMPVGNQRDFLRNTKIEEVMVREPETVDSGENLRAAGELLIENKFG